jgi:hypothetical protein
MAQKKSPKKWNFAVRGEILAKLASAQEGLRLPFPLARHQPHQTQARDRHSRQTRTSNKP